MSLQTSANVTSLHATNTGEAVDGERRGFVKKVSAAVLTLGIGGALARFMKPNVLYEPPKVFKVGVIGNFPIGSRTVIEGKGIEVVRERDGIHAVSLVCTHLGCLIKPVENDAEIGYACPCHGSTFNLTGKVLGGPAPKDLPWYEIYQDHQGSLMVDTSKVNQKQTKLVV